MKIKELIVLLQAMDQEAPVVILDADTGWSLNIQHVDTYNERVEISGDYNDEYDFENVKEDET